MVDKPMGLYSHKFDTGKDRWKAALVIQIRTDVVGHDLDPDLK